MKNIIYLIGFALAGGINVLPAYAQQSSITQKRIVVDKAISTLEDYESCATISDDEIKYIFEELFVNENAQVYNDLLGISHSFDITAKEYSQKMREELQNKKVIISNIKKKRVWNENNIWKVVFTFDKTLSYTNNCGIYFSSTDFYGKQYQLEATLVYNEQLKKCKIEKITGSIDSQKKLPKEFFAFKSEDKRDHQLLYRKKRLSLNSYDQIILDGPFEKSAFTYSDPDVELIPVVDDCNNVSMTYKERRLRLKAYYSMGIGDAVQIEDNNILSNAKSNASSIGLDFGYVFPSKSNIKTGVFVGLGYSKTTLDLGYQNPDYYYESVADVDNDQYIRHYEGLRLNQRIMLSEINIPLYLDINAKLHQMVSLYFNIGARFNLNMSNKIDKTEGSANIYGIYPQYDNLYLDGQWGYNGFGANTFSNNNLISKDIQGVSKMTVDAIGGAGLRIKMPKTPIAINLGVAYEFGLMDMLKQDSNQREFINTKLVYNTVNGNSSTEHVRNLSDVTSNVKRKSFKLNIGAIINF